MFWATWCILVAFLFLECEDGWMETLGFCIGCTIFFVWAGLFMYQVIVILGCANSSYALIKRMQQQWFQMGPSVYVWVFERLYKEAIAFVINGLCIVIAIIQQPYIQQVGSGLKFDFSYLIALQAPILYVQIVQLRI